MNKNQAKARSLVVCILNERTNERTNERMNELIQLQLKSNPKLARIRNGNKKIEL